MPDINAILTVTLAAGRYGTPRPQIEVRVPAGSTYRELHAALHQVAAEVELATPPRERWVVQMESMGDGRGRVYLELEHGTEAETNRGMGVLTLVAA